MKSFRDLVCPGHYKVSMGHHLLLRSPKGSLEHQTLLIICIVPGGLSLQESRKSQPILKINNKKKMTQERPFWDGRRLYQ